MTKKNQTTNISVGPSILNANFTILKEECDSLISAGAGHLHLDVMDGHFVPNISFGMPVVADLRKLYPDQYLDVHLMVSEPEKWVDGMAKAGASSYTFHTEAVDDNNIEKCAELVNKILSNKINPNMDAGFSIKPKTPVEVALNLLNHSPEMTKNIKQVLIMTVEPGFGGQSFMVDMMEKVKILRQWAVENDRDDLIIQVDGGVKPGETARLSAEAGANYFVSGSGIVKAKCRKSATLEMESILKEYFDVV